MALGTSWNTPRIALTGGLRLDANTFTGAPAHNAALEQALGVANDAKPNSFAVSPRFGFYWYYKTRGASMSINNSGYSSTIRAGPQIRGGFGEFRNNLRSDLLADAIGSTGLPGSTQRLLCTGPAAPVPNWQAYMNDPASVPSTCAGGTNVFADTAPNVVAIDGAYRPSRSRRATLGWTNTIFGSYFTLDGTYSQNLNQAGVIDANPPAPRSSRSRRKRIARYSSHRRASSQARASRRPLSHVAPPRSAASQIACQTCVAMHDRSRRISFRTFRSALAL